MRHWVPGRKPPWVEGGREGRARCYPFHLVTRKAELLDAIGRWAQAEDLYRQQLAWSEEAGLTKYQAESLNALGWIDHQRNEDDRARELISQALSLYEQTGDAEGQARAHSQLGGTYYQIGDYPQALEHYRQAQELSRRLGDLQSEAKAWNNIGNVVGEKGDNREALTLYHRALEASRATGNLFMEAVVSGNIGAGHLSLGDYHQAQTWFSRQLELSSRLGNKLIISSACGSLAGAHLKMGEPEKALDILATRLKISEEIGDIKGQALAWDYLGNVQYTKGEYGRAENAFLRAVQLGRQANIKFFLCNFLQNLACLYLETSRPAQAEEVNNQALELAGEMGLSEAAFVSRRIAAKILALKDPTAAVAALRELLPQAGDKEREAEVQMCLFEVTNDENSRQAALKIYRMLNEKNPTIEYSQRIKRLEQTIK